MCRDEVMGAGTRRGEGGTVNEDPSTKDLLKEGTRTKVSPVAAVQTVVVGVLKDVPRIVGGLVRRVRR